VKNDFEINKLIEEQGVLVKGFKANLEDKEAFALSRKDTFGGSDTSILLGVNLYTTIEQLREQKHNKFLTDEEKAVGEKPIVRKGADLEPFILSKAEEEIGYPIYKPENTYIFKEFEYMSLNYDGVFINEQGKPIPVEAKLVSKFGEKYYKKDISIKEMQDIIVEKKSDDIATHIKLLSNKYGIPPYYYTQVQREIEGLNANYGYLIAWFDESWTGKLYYIKRDDYVIVADIKACEKNRDCLQ
jgi:hypothetical protein